MFGRSNNSVSSPRTWRSKTALLATLVVAASVVATGQAVAALPGTADLVVHAGGIRTGTTTVSGLGGAIFQAAPVGGGPALTCTTNAAGTCTINVPTGVTSATRVAYVVSESVAPAGWYLNPNLDYGSSTSGTATPYQFRTGPLVSGSSVDVPGSVNDGSYNDASSPGRPFSGLFSTSRNNPIAPTACGLKIALILDQSGSMNSGTKQADLKTAAKKVITTLTGTPSQMAIYTFGANTGGSVALTSMGSTAQAAPLTNFVNGLPTPSGGTNWDRGFAQAVTATKTYDLVVVLTDGNPTLDHTGSGGSSTTNFHNVDNGIFSTNAIKNLGSRVVAIGIGVAGGQDNLRAISGPILNSDYYLGTTGNFDDVFKSLATGNCEGIITVQKQIQDFQGNLITNSAAANGWNFAGTVSAPAANLTFPSTATVNGATGFTQSTVTIPAGGTPTVTITETLSAGYTFVGAICSVNGTPATTTAAGTAGHPGVSFTAAAAAALACTFTNKQVPPTSSLVVQKLDSTTNGTVAGATFQLYRETTVGTRNPLADVAVDAPCVTTGSPAQCVSAATLSFGTYYWVETGAPAGYVLPTGTAAFSAAYTIDVTHNGTAVATLTVSDAEVLSSLAITKLDAITGVALPGATFQLYRELAPGTQNPGSDTAVGGPCTTAGTPAQCVSALTLTFGTYYWVETAAPTGYLLPAAGAARNSAPFTIDAAHTGASVATLSVRDTQLTSSLVIQKLDATSGLAIAGATFQLYRETTVGTQAPAADIAVGSPCTTAGTPAQCASPATLPFGTYYWVETVAPAGYVLPSGAAAYSAEYTLDANHTGVPASTLSVSDARKLSSLTVRKLDGTTNQPIAGATFTLYREANAGTQNPALDTAFGSCTTAGNPAQCTSVATLTFGSYYWVETAAPNGYVLPTGAAANSAVYTIDAAHTGSPVTTLSVSDAQVTSTLAIRKLDATTQAPVSGATFQLYREAVVGTQNPGADTALGTCTTSGSPAQCSLAGLTFGTYYWVETVAPGGYVLPTGISAYSNATTIDVAYAVAGSTATVTVTDAQVLSSLAVRKLDGTTNAAVSGATFQLYRELSAGTQNPATDTAVGTPCVTNAVNCTRTGLSFGTYYWVETAAPVGYVLPASPADRSLPTTIDAGYAAAGLTVTVSFSDAQVLSRLAVQKLDSATGNPVDGATFQLYRELAPGTENPTVDAAIGMGCTTTAGSCSQTGLTFGTYYWVETAAPAGYVLPTGSAGYSAATTINAASAASGTTVTLTVADAQLPSGLAVRKLDASTNAAVNGAKFQLYREVSVGTQNPALDTAVGAVCTTAAANTPANSCSATGLAFGTYYWVETAAPTGYVLPIGAAGYSAATTIDAAYAAAGTTTTLVVYDAQELSSLTVRKLDGTTNAAVVGATFQLYREAVVGTQNPGADVALDTCTTSGSAAECSSAQTLTFGTYYWVETIAPAGYVLPTGSNAYTAASTIDATHTGSPVATVSVTDAQTLSSLAVRKVDATTQLPIAGATFQLYREAVVGTQSPAADTALGTCTTSGNPAECTSTATLTFGTYYWVETAAPTGYVLPTGSNAYTAATTIDATHVGSPAATVSVTDAQTLSSLAVRKLDGTTDAAVAGATFQLYRELSAGTQDPTTDTAVGPACVTDAVNCTRTGLSFGTYYWVETAAPVGYVLPASPADRSLPTTIDAAYAAAGTTSTVSVTDAQILSTLAVQKLDATTNSPVDGATFQLYRELAPGTENPAVDPAIGMGCTTTAGSCSQTGLTFGTYYWVETAAPAGYVLPTGSAAYTAATTIDAAYAAGGSTSTLSVADAQVLSTLSVRKTDEASNVLAGATFQLWLDATPDVLIGQCTTDVLGTCSVGSLAFGTYYWVEISPPPFYELPDNPVSALIVVGPGVAGTTLPATSFADPATPVATVTKTVQSTTQNADGTWTIGYDVAVTNPSAKYATTYELVDTLAFGSGIHVVSAGVTGPADVTLASPPWNGGSEPIVVSGQSLAASTTDHYTVVVVATVDPDANRTCDTGGGFANTSSVSLQANQPVNVLRAAALVSDASQSASACSEPASPAIAKTFVSAVQHLTGGVADGSVDVTYTLTVANPSTSAALSYSLSDTPAFPADVTVNRGTVTGTDGTTPITVTPGWNGTTNTVIVTGRALPAQGTDTYTVVVNATVPANADAAELPCTNGGSGTGFANAATAISGGDAFTANACGPITISGTGGIIITPPVTPQSGPLAFTGVPVWQLIWAGIALLIGGVALLVLIGRRRPEAGDVR